MKSIDLIRKALELSTDVTMALIRDMQDAPLTFPTPRGGNHPLWVLGHLAWSEGELVQYHMLARPNPLAHWRDLFGDGSEPTADASRYPPFDEVLAAYRRLRGETLELLATLTDADLDKPSHAPRPGFERVIGTYGGCLLVVALNTMSHRGQVADARRALGRDRLMM